MKGTTGTLLYYLVMVVLIVCVDVLFFRDRFWPRLAVNVAIVLVFAIVYLIFQKRS